MRAHRGGVLPGFGLTFGYAMFYLGVIVLLPVLALAGNVAAIPWDRFRDAVLDPRTLAAYRLTFLASLCGAGINAIFGFIVAWSLTRYSFPGRRFLDALVDLPFAMPTAVSGIALAAVYSKTGWIGRYLDAMGVSAAYSRLGVVIALTFIGLPFVVRTLQPAIEDLDPAMEEAASILGAGRWQTFRRVLIPVLVPPLITGFALAFARALGEYGSVIFIAGNMPMKTEIISLLVITRLEQFDYAGATAIGAAMLAISFVLLLVINLLQRWTNRSTEGV